MEDQQRYDGLPLVEQTVLWAIRCWAIGCRSKIDVKPRLTALFTSLHAAEAVPHLDGLMCAMNSGATRMIDIACVCWSHVNSDETLILDSMALHQEHRAVDAPIVLAAFLDPASAMIASESAGRFALTLNARGHHLPRGGDALRRHAFASPLRHASAFQSASLH